MAVLDFRTVRRTIDKGGGVLVGQTPDGKTVAVYTDSSDGRPTLDIQDGKKHIKKRYDERKPEPDEPRKDPDDKKQ
jgi:hypothetical protein